MSMPVTGKASNITVDFQENVFVDEELKIGYNNTDGSNNMGTIEVDHIDPNSITQPIVFARQITTEKGLVDPLNQTDKIQIGEVTLESNSQATKVTY